MSTRLAIRAAVSTAALLALVALGALYACNKPESAVSTGGGATARMDGFCSVAGLPAALRQTVVVIDQQAVRKAANAALIRTENPELFQLINGLGNTQAVETGASAPRERISLYLAPIDGAAPRLIFSGCVPGVSADERKALASKTSGAAQASDSFFGQGVTDKARAAAESFQSALLGALVHITADAPDPSAPAAFLERPFLRSLQAAPLASPENGIPRIFLYTDVANFAPEELADVGKARSQGFSDADKVRLALGRAQVHLIGPKPARSSLVRQYADALMLGSEGRLLSFGGVNLNSLPPAPVKVETYTGDIAYPPDRTPMQMRLAADRNGTLVDSWVVVKAERSTSTPLTGSLTCDGDAVCRVATDQGGFAQAWAREPGPEFKPESGLPLGGLRALSAEIRDGKMTGKVSDPAVDRIGASGLSALDFKLTLTP